MKRREFLASCALSLIEPKISRAQTNQGVIARLHNHTSYSDGFRTVASQAKQARETQPNVKAILFTDHDDKIAGKGWKELKRDCARFSSNGLRLLPSIEHTIHWLDEDKESLAESHIYFIGETEAMVKRTEAVMPYKSFLTFPRKDYFGFLCKEAYGSGRPIVFAHPDLLDPDPPKNIHRWQMPPSWLAEESIPRGSLIYLELFNTTYEDSVWNAINTSVLIEDSGYKVAYVSGADYHGIPVDRPVSIADSVDGYARKQGWISPYPNPLSNLTMFLPTLMEGYQKGATISWSGNVWIEAVSPTPNIGVYRDLDEIRVRINQSSIVNMRQAYMVYAVTDFSTDPITRFQFRNTKEAYISIATLKQLRGWRDGSVHSVVVVLAKLSGGKNPLPLCVVSPIRFRVP